MLTTKKSYCAKAESHISASMVPLSLISLCHTSGDDSSNIGCFRNATLLNFPGNCQKWTVMAINGKWFKPRSLSRLCGLIVRVGAVSRSTVGGDIDRRFDNVIGGKRTLGTEREILGLALGTRREDGISRVKIPTGR